MSVDSFYVCAYMSYKEYTTWKTDDSYGYTYTIINRINDAFKKRFGEVGLKDVTCAILYEELRRFELPDYPINMHLRMEECKDYLYSSVHKMNDPPIRLFTATVKYSWVPISSLDIKKYDPDSCKFGGAWYVCIFEVKEGWNRGPKYPKAKVPCKVDIFEDGLKVFTTQTVHHKFEEEIKALKETNRQLEEYNKELETMNATLNIEKEDLKKIIRMRENSLVKAEDALKALSKQRSYFFPRDQNPSLRVKHNTKVIVDDQSEP